MLIPNSSLVPPGGHHFVDSSTGVPVRIEGTSEQDVADKLLRHRLSNQRPPGNPLAEIRAFVCGNWPHFCREVDAPKAAETPAKAPRQHISIRVATWLANFVRLAAADHGVHASKAEQRATICAQCPKNVSYESGCGACQEAIQRLSFIWKRDRRTASDPMLKACDVTNQHNGCAVWAEKLPLIAEETAAKLPANCWRRVRAD